MCFDADEHIAVKTAYAIDQKIIAACAHHNRRRGKRVLAAVIDSIRRGVPAPLGAVFVGVFGGAAVYSSAVIPGVCMRCQAIKDYKLAICLRNTPISMYSTVQVHYRYIVRVAPRRRGNRGRPMARPASVRRSTCRS